MVILLLDRAWGSLSGKDPFPINARYSSVICQSASSSSAARLSACLQQRASITVDQITLIGWSLGSAVAVDLAGRLDVRAQVLLSPLTSLLACALDLVRIGKTSFTIGPFDALSRARSVNCPTLIVSGSEDALTRPWMANELTKAMEGHARLVSLAGVGHNDMLRSGERLWNVVKDFLNSPEETR